MCEESENERRGEREKERERMGKRIKQYKKQTTVGINHVQKGIKCEGVGACCFKESCR